MPRVRHNLTWMLMFALANTACGGASGGSPGGTSDAAPNPPTTAPLTVAEAAPRVAATWMADIAAEDMEWDWGDGVLTFGMLELADVTGDTRYRDYVERYVLHHQQRGAELELYWSDHMTSALSAALLVQRAQTPVEPILERAIDYLGNRAPRTEAGGIRHLGLFLPFFLADLWVDSLFHICPLLARYSQITSDPTYLDEAAQQLLVFARSMQDPDTGLITHGYAEAEDIQVPSFAERAFWARGNGWMLAAMVDIAAQLPPDHPAAAELGERLTRLEDALRALQDPTTSLFHTVLLDTNTYVETAGSGLIVYAMARGVREGLFGPETGSAAQRGMNGLLAVVVAPDNSERLEVSGISDATLPVATTYAYIPQRRQLSYGVGAWLLAASEYLR